MIGVLTYFFRFQIEQSKRGISINKERYVKDLLRKYDKIGSSMNTLIVPPNILGPDLNGKAVNESQYKGMIGSLMNLTASRLGHSILNWSLCKTSSKHKESHLIVVKQIFRKSTSADAEDVVVVGCCANILWIKSQLTDYDIIYEKIKNHTLKRDIEFHFIPTQYQLADIFIKPLYKPSFKRLIDELGVGSGGERWGGDGWEGRLKELGKSGRGGRVWGFGGEGRSGGRTAVRSWGEGAIYGRSQLAELEYSGCTDGCTLSKASEAC
ncbi:hypothetical protein Tco_1018386 [Tanacetum coccineum]|uniref:Uncharacterized protein n=1 Tax=Tanacetum coccineum TaxID=301880 RepID=A0ABQ5FU60_9ASTR